jgi:YcxB-like protein
MITGSISISEYLNSQRLYRQNSVRWYYAISVACIFIGLTAYFIFKQGFGGGLAGAGFGLLVTELGTSLLYLPWKMRRLYHQQKDLVTLCTYTWNNEFLEGSSATAHSTRRWSSYLKYSENEELFLLHHNDIIYEIFPKIWFKDETQIREFRTLAQQAKGI